MALGLSSLSRLESRVLPTLRSVRATLAARELFGLLAGSRHAALLVTCKSEAADDPSFMLQLAERGVEAMRINRAHDDPARWQRLIDHLHVAAEATGRRMKILMVHRRPQDPQRPCPRAETPARQHRRPDRDRGGRWARPGRTGRGAVRRRVNIGAHWRRRWSGPPIGARVFVDDGELCVRVERKTPWGVVGRVTATSDMGVRLKPENGLNFPDTPLAFRR
jgi:pyruvate kinase